MNYDGPVLVGIGEAVKIVGKSAYSFRKEIKEGTLPFVRSGQRILIHMPRLLEQLEQEAGGGREPN